ncbi:MAG: Ku protein [Pirellulales bacterium]
MPRPVWSGFIRLSLVSVPVRAFPAESKEGRDLAFHQLHDKCHSRIRYQKVCPIHGEVSNDEIVSAYEVEKGKYVVVDDEEKKSAVGKAGKRDAGKRGGNKALTIANFIPPEAVDPLYFEGSSYYLLPDGDGGEHPYALLARAMADEGRWALAEAVLWKRERLVLLRSEGKLLTMSLLHYAKQLRKADDFHEDLPTARVAAAELRLAKRLVAESSVEEVDWAEYEDDVRKQLAEVIDAKVSKDDVIETTEADEEAAPVINLMEALKKSVGAGKKRNGSGRSSRAAKSPGKQLTVMRIPHAASYRRKPKAKSKKRKAS